MTNIAQLAGPDSSVMVPVVSENGGLMAWMLYPDPTGILQECYSPKTIPRAFTDHSLSTPPQDNADPGTLLRAFGGYGWQWPWPWQSVTAQDSWAGRLSIRSSKKRNNMATTASSNGVTAERIKNDPVFERTRENMAEFARAGKAAKLTRTVFREVSVNAKDRITQARLVKVFSRVVASDLVNGRGERTVSNGDLLQLNGFNFNARASLTEALYARCSVSINRATGQVQVSIPAFVPRVMVQAPRGATHYRIVAAAAAIDYDTEVYEYAMQGTAELLWNHELNPAQPLTLSLPAASPGAIIVAVGIEFYQLVNTRMYVLKTGELNATSILKVEKPAVVEI